MTENIDALEPRIYETSFWLISTMDESKLAEAHKSLQVFVTKKGGSIIAEASPEIKDIAYPMVKIVNNKRMWFTTGYFGWIKFEIDPEKAIAIKEDLDNFEPLIRFLTVKTVREDTMAKKKKTTRVKGMSEPVVTEKAAVNPSEDTGAQINEEVLDDKIEDLVSEEG